MKNVLRRVVYLKCELTSRDLDSRILIAGHLLKDGFTVVIGQLWALYANLLAGNTPVGCCLFATANKNQVDVMKAWRDAGHIVIASDQEGLPFADEGFLANIDPAALTVSHIFLAQSAAQGKILENRFPNVAARIAVAGSPRVDLLRNARHPTPLTPRYILFNTSFGLVNSIWGPVEAACARLLAGAGISNAELVERVQVERYAYGEMIKLMKWVLTACDIHMVLRPHPSENAAAWTSFLPASPRLSIVTGSDPAPWMQHAALTVHSESTTGIEAAILGVRCLNLSPSPQWSKRFTMRDVNENAVTAAEAQQKIAAFLMTERWPDYDRRVADLFPQDGAGITARNIMEALATAIPLDRLRWQKVERRDAQRAKFSISAAEFQQRAAAVFDNAGIALAGSVGMAELDDSVFMLAPTARAPILE